MKSENSGNDPTVSLVPSGGGGWGSAKEKPSETPPVATPQAAPPSSTPSQTNAPSSQQPLLQPQRPTAPPSHPQHVQQPQPQSQNSGQTQTQPAKQQESQGKTWGSVSSNEGGGQGKESQNLNFQSYLHAYLFCLANESFDNASRLMVIENFFALRTSCCGVRCLTIIRNKANAFVPIRNLLPQL